MVRVRVITTKPEAKRSYPEDVLDVDLENFDEVYKALEFIEKALQRDDIRKVEIQQV